jgi:hypothetical protein
MSLVSDRLPLLESEAQHRCDLHAHLAAANLDRAEYERHQRTLATMDHAQEVCAWASGQVDTLTQVAGQLDKLAHEPDALAAALRVLPPETLQALYTASIAVIRDIEAQQLC